MTAYEEFNSRSERLDMAGLSQIEARGSDGASAVAFFVMSIEGIWGLVVGRKCSLEVLSS